MIIQFPGPRGPRPPTDPLHTDGTVPDHLERQWLADLPNAAVVLGVPLSGDDIVSLQDALDDLIDQWPTDIELAGIGQLERRLHAFTGEDLPPRLRREESV